MSETETTGNIQDMFKNAIDSIVNGGSESPPTNTQADDENRRQQEEINRRNQILQQQQRQQQQIAQQNYQNTLNMFENPVLNFDEISKQIDNMLDTKNNPSKSNLMYYVMGGGLLFVIFCIMNKSSYNKREEYY